MNTAKQKSHFKFYSFIRFHARPGNYLNISMIFFIGKHLFIQYSNSSREEMFHYPTARHKLVLVSSGAFSDRKCVLQANCQANFFNSENLGTKHDNGRLRFII
jgi:hypothetical protein